MQVDRFLPAAVAHQFIQFGHLPRQNVAGGADKTGASDGQDRVAEGLDPGIDQEIAAAQPQDVADLFKILVGLLHPHHVGTRFPKAGKGLRFHVDGGPARDVVDDDGDVHGLRHAAEMLEQPLLGGFVVIGDDHQRRIGPQLLRPLGQVQRFLVVVGTRSQDDGGPSGHVFHGDGHHPLPLLEGERGGFARGAGHRNAVGPVFKLPVDQLPQLRLVHLIPFVKGGDHRTDRAAQPVDVLHPWGLLLP